MDFQEVVVNRLETISRDVRQLTIANARHEENIREFVDLSLKTASDMEKLEERIEARVTPIETFKRRVEGGTMLFTGISFIIGLVLAASEVLSKI